jgi:DNA-binding transcriptional MocR family regulator
MSYNTTSVSCLLHPVQEYDRAYSFAGEPLLTAVRRESAERQALAASILRDATFRADPGGFYLWLSLPAAWSRSAFAGHMRAGGIGIVPSDVFTVSEMPAESVRVCPGGPANRLQVKGALEFMAHALAEKPSMTSAFL